MRGTSRTATVVAVVFCLSVGYALGALGGESNGPETQGAGEPGRSSDDPVARAEQRLAEAQQLVQEGQAGPEELLTAQTRAAGARVTREVESLRDLHAERLDRLVELREQDEIAASWVDRQRDRLERLDLLMIALPSLLDSVAAPAER